MIKKLIAKIALNYEYWYVYDMKAYEMNNPRLYFMFYLFNKMVGKK